MKSKITLLACLTMLAILSLPINGFATVHSITIGNNFFSPSGTIVTPGDTVRWTWAGGLPHSTTSDGSSPKAWDSGVSSTGGNTFDLVFSVVDGPGPFPYHCSVHFATMFDTVFVAAVPIEYNSIWEASSGLLPEDNCPKWEQLVESDGEVPFLTGDTLVISTSQSIERLLYGMSTPNLRASLTAAAVVSTPSATLVMPPSISSSLRPLASCSPT